MKKYILAADQGTTSSRAVLFDEEFNVIDIVGKEYTQHYPKEGYVEHDPMEIYESEYYVIDEVIKKNSIDPSLILAIGITNQRETTIVWDKITGKPIYNAIVWQCRRTADICANLIKNGWEEYIKRTTGLVIDAYFSATKIKWILDNVEGARQKADNNELMFGTVDSWLIYNMTNKTVHVTDYTNASRTMLYDIHNLKWDEKLCRELNIPLSMLPVVKSSSDIYGYFDYHGTDIPIAGIAGDQQAALFGHRCVGAGEAKNTYGTGCFLLMNTGDTAIESSNGLITTIAASQTESKVQYALEGSVFTAGAVVQWLRDELKLIETAAETENLAKEVTDSGWVLFIPAFTGLGAPYWDMYARGTIAGITRGTKKQHIVRAALEAIAFQTDSVIKAMEQDVGYSIDELKVDGGASANNFLMQFQADISDITIHRPLMLETTALGAAYLAALAVGHVKDIRDLNSLEQKETIIIPDMEQSERDIKKKLFEEGVKRASNWIVS